MNITDEWSAPPKPVTRALNWVGKSLQGGYVRGYVRAEKYALRLSVFSAHAYSDPETKTEFSVYHSGYHSCDRIETNGTTGISNSCVRSSC